MIAHVDADSFFASVLMRKDPSLRGKPLLALGMGGGCVIAASYEAKAKGVRTGMRLKDALLLVPDALRVPSDFQETGLASQQIESVLRDVCPSIEQMSIDEWYLDLRSVVGGVPVDLSAFGKKVRSDILLRTGLSVSAGIAGTKLLAKMAGEYRKPGGITVILPEHLEIWDRSLPAAHASEFAIGRNAFLQNRPAAAIPGIGHRRSVHAEREGWKTALDIAQAPTETLLKLFGRPGSDLQRELRGEKIFPVVTESGPPKSVSRARSFRPEKNQKFLWAHLLRHLEYTVLKMRRHKLRCNGISVWIRDRQYEYESAHASLPQPMGTEEALQPYVRRCFRRLWQARLLCTQIGLALWRLSPEGALQYSLFEETKHAIGGERVQQTLDLLHTRFGRNAITRAASLEVPSGTTMGMGLPLYE